MNKRKKCPKCKRSLYNIHSYHYCKEVAFDDLFLHKSDEILLLYDKLMQTIENWEDIEISATKNCIVFLRTKTFLVLKPMTKFLEIKFYSSEMIEDDELHKCQIWNSKFACILRLKTENELVDRHFDYFLSSYKIS